MIGFAQLLCLAVHSLIGLSADQGKAQVAELRACGAP